MAELRGTTRDAVLSEELREQRRVRWIAVAAGLCFLLLAIAAGLLAVVAEWQRREKVICDATSGHDIASEEIDWFDAPRDAIAPMPPATPREWSAKVMAAFWGGDQYDESNDLEHALIADARRALNLEGEA